MSNLQRNKYQHYCFHNISLSPFLPWLVSKQTLVEGKERFTMCSSSATRLLSSWWNTTRLCSAQSASEMCSTQLSVRKLPACIQFQPAKLPFRKISTGQHSCCWLMARGSKITAHFSCFFPPAQGQNKNRSPKLCKRFFYLDWDSFNARKTNIRIKQGTALH